MKVGERGQVTIPAEIRERYGFGPAIEVEIVEEDGRVVIRKKRQGESPIGRFIGVLGTARSTDELVEHLRGR